MSATPKYLLELMYCPDVRFNRYGPEDRECAIFAVRLRDWTVTGRLRHAWFHSPNEGKRAGRTGNKLKVLGLIPGVPDYVFIGGGARNSACIEFKSEKGRQSHAQQNFEKWCYDVGLWYEVVRSADEGEATLKRTGILLDG